jgi:hypothetical protein
MWSKVNNWLQDLDIKPTTNNNLIVPQPQSSLISDHQSSFNKDDAPSIYPSSSMQQPTTHHAYKASTIHQVSAYKTPEELMIENKPHIYKDSLILHEPAAEFDKFSFNFYQDNSSEKQ